MKDEHKTKRLFLDELAEMRQPEEAGLTPVADDPLVAGSQGED